jgi:uncharacterized protein YfkK (UPF0435 family)
MENKENKEKKKEQTQNFTDKQIEEEGKGTDFVSIAKSVKQGYEVLSGTFSPHQANIAQKFNLGEGIKTLVVNWQEIHGDVHGNVTQVVGSQVNFNQQVTDAFKKAYSMVEKKEDISPEQKDVIVKNLNVLEEELQSKELDAGKIQEIWKWLKRNSSWLVPTLSTVIVEGIKIACGV